MRCANWFRFNRMHEKNGNSICPYKWHNLPIYFYHMQLAWVYIVENWGALGFSVVIVTSMFSRADI